MYFLSIHKDLSLGKLQHAEQHFHQRGFSRAVFPHQRMDLAFYTKIGRCGWPQLLPDTPLDIPLQDIPLLHMIFLRNGPAFLRGVTFLSCVKGAEMEISLSTPS